MPMATSRPLSFSPSMPIAKPLSTVKPMRPHNGETPTSTAPVAPVNPTCERACPANVWPRMTRKKPTTPDSTATTPDAAKAVRMKSYSNMTDPAVLRRCVTVTGVIVVTVIVPLDVEFTGHNENAATDA